MEIGIVESFPQSQGNGFVVSSMTREHLTFNVTEGRKIRIGANAPVFNSKPARRTPQPGDLIVFERKLTDRGSAHAAPWGFYRSYRHAYKALVAPCIPGHSLLEYPFLLDVLILARSRYIPGRFKVRSAPLTKEVLESVGVDDISAYRLKYYYVANRMAPASWFVHELEATYWVRTEKERRLFGTHTVKHQVARLGLDPRDDDVRLVLLEATDQMSKVRVADETHRVHAYPLDQRRQLTVYLP